MSGWQQAPISVQRTRATCLHLGLISASFTLSQHREGHEWICFCGQRFVVVSNCGKDKRLVKRPIPFAAVPDDRDNGRDRR